MSDYALVPALAELPHELLRLIIEALCASPYTDPACAALSQTCRSFRAFLAPGLRTARYARVHVRTVRRLGLLRDILREQPDIGSFIRHFTFSWTMNDDFYKCEPYADEYGSLLEMAFIDRGAVWEEHRQRLAVSTRSVHYQSDHHHHHHLEEASEEASEEMASSFEYNGVAYIEPGRSSPGAARAAARLPFHEESINNPFVKEECWDDAGRRFFAYVGPNIDRSGPDGKGEDVRVRNTQDFNECISEVVSQMSNLDAFAWQCPVTPLPEGVFKALKNGKPLKSLELNMDCRRKNLTAQPVWELASQLTHLHITDIYSRSNVLLEFLSHSPKGHGSLSLPAMRGLEEAARLEGVQTLPGGAADAQLDVLHEQVVDQHLEDELDTSFDLSLVSHGSSLESIRRVHLYIGARTVVVAARGSQLKSLKFRDAPLQKPYTIRSLLPLWIGVEDWGPGLIEYEEDENGTTELAYWAYAAVDLRHILAYASRQLSSTSRPDRLLTCEDVRALLGSSDEVSFKREAYHRWDEYFFPEEAYIKTYLRWLAEDAELAQQVAEAWNELVQCGKADFDVDVRW